MLLRQTEMILHIDDTGSKTKLVITNGTKTLLKRKGKSIRSLLKFVYDGSTKQNVKDSIRNLQPLMKLMSGSITKIEVK